MDSRRARAHQEDLCTVLSNKHVPFHTMSSGPGNRAVVGNATSSKRQHVDNKRKTYAVKVCTCLTKRYVHNLL
jgi:hypothetical protein